jgi:ankyrin repeat protein
LVNKQQWRYTLLQGIIDNALRKNESVPQAISRFYEAFPSSLLNAVENNNLSQVTSLISEGASPNTRLRNGCPVLINAIRGKKDINIIKKLLEAGADVNLFWFGGGFMQPLTAYLSKS